MASPIPQYFQDSYSVPLFQNDQSLVLDTSIELLREPSNNLKTCWAHNLHNYFQNQDSYTLFLEQSFEEKSEIEKSIEILHETSQQFQNLLPSLSID